MKREIPDTTLSNVIRMIQETKWDDYDRVDIMMQAISQWQAAVDVVHQFGSVRHSNGEMCLNFVLEMKRINEEEGDDGDGKPFAGYD